MSQFYPNFQGYQFGMPNYMPNYSFGQNMSGMNNQQQLNDVISGSIVDSVDVVKAKNCNLDGSASYFPKSDKTEIYCKQLNPNTGAGMILTYKLVQSPERQDTSIEEQVSTILSSFKTDMMSEISELKTLVLDNLTRPTQTVRPVQQPQQVAQNRGVTK